MIVYFLVYLFYVALMFGATRLAYNFLSPLLKRDFRAAFQSEEEREAERLSSLAELDGQTAEEEGRRAAALEPAIAHPASNASYADAHEQLQNAADTAYSSYAWRGGRR